MFLLSEISCDICGASHSKSGKPFDKVSLARHMATVHPPERHTYSASELICDICGVNQSSTGKRFTLPSQVWQHKKKRHPHALKRSTPPDLRVPVVATPQTEASDNCRESEPPKNDAVKFCPCCGYHLGAVNAAMASWEESKDAPIVSPAMQPPTLGETKSKSTSILPSFRQVPTA